MQLILWASESYFATLVCFIGLKMRYQHRVFFFFFYSITIMSVLITWERPKCTDKLGTGGTQRLKVSDEYPQQLHCINKALYENNNNSIPSQQNASVWLECNVSGAGRFRTRWLMVMVIHDCWTGTVPLFLCPHSLLGGGNAGRWG